VDRANTNFAALKLLWLIISRYHPLGKKMDTKEFKEATVKLITEEGYSILDAGRNLGVNPNLLFYCIPRRR
jgi:hypothetical protein